MNFVRILREGFIKRGFEGWIGVCGVGSWGRGRKIVCFSSYRFMKDLGWFGD